jgi:hypothetical protein
LSTLSEVVAAALGARGHNPDDTEWDAWKGDDNRWVVQVSWRVGRSVNRAHWRYVPGSNSGTVEAIDEVADELTDPDMSRPLRSVIAVAPVEGRYDATEDNTYDYDHPELAFDYTPPPAAQVTPVSRPARLTVKSDGTEAVTVDADSLTGAQKARRIPPRQAEPVPAATPDSPTPDGRGADTPADEHSDADQPATEEQAPAPRKRGRGSRKPAVPTWEDVLLGVRSSGNT